MFLSFFFLQRAQDLMKHTYPALQYSRMAKMVSSSTPGKKMGWDQQEAEQRQGDPQREMNTEARLKYERV